jgi:hypothetical protein
MEERIMPKYNKKKDEEENLIREIIRGIVGFLVFIYSGSYEGANVYAQVQDRSD